MRLSAFCLMASEWKGEKAKAVINPFQGTEKAAPLRGTAFLVFVSFLTGFLHSNQEDVPECQVFCAPFMVTSNPYTQPSPRHHSRSHEVDTDFSQTSNLCTRSEHRIFTLSSILLTRERRHQICPHEVDTVWSHFHQCY